MGIRSGLRSSSEQQRDDDDNTDGITGCFLAAEWFSIFQNGLKLACDHLSESDAIIMESMSYGSALIYQGFFLVWFKAYLILP